VGFIRHEAFEEVIRARAQTFRTKRIMFNKNKTKSDVCHTTGSSPSGYHDNAVTLCGSVLQSILKNVWRQEEISGSPDKLNLTTLLEHTKDKPQDPLISRYLAEITEASTKADSGEHLEMEEAFEMLRKVCTVSMWYLAKYPFGPTKYIWKLLSRPAPVFSLVLLFFVVATALTTSVVIRWSKSTSPIAFEETYASALGGQGQVTKNNELFHESLSNYEWIQVAIKEIQQENWDEAIFANLRSQPSIEKQSILQNLHNEGRAVYA